MAEADFMWEKGGSWYLLSLLLKGFLWHSLALQLSNNCSHYTSSGPLRLLQIFILFSLQSSIVF